MPKVSLLVLLRLTLVCLLQLTFCGVETSPADSVISNHLQQLDESSKASWPSDVVVSPQRVRSALRALLALNDGELQSVLGGSPPHLVAPKLSPSTVLFLAATQRKLAKLRQALPHLQQIPGDMTIAKRRKNVIRNDDGSDKKDLDPDSLLTALSQLSAYVEGRQTNPMNDDWDTNTKDNLIDSKEQSLNTVDLSIVKSRSRRSHKERNAHHHKKHENCNYHRFHPEIWYRPKECPRTADGTRQVFCPTPDDDGDWVCIDPDELCDDLPHCPDSADELPQSCLFYTTMRDQFDEVFSILNRLLK